MTGVIGEDAERLDHIQHLLLPVEDSHHLKSTLVPVSAVLESATLSSSPRALLLLESPSSSSSAPMLSSFTFILLTSARRTSMFLPSILNLERHASILDSSPPTCSSMSARCRFMRRYCLAVAIYFTMGSVCRFLIRSRFERESSMSSIRSFRRTSRVGRSGGLLRY